jgi:hypothetical protein
MNFLKPYKSKNCQITLVEYKIISDYEEFEKKCDRDIFKSRKKYVAKDGVCIDCYNEMRSSYLYDNKYLVNRIITQIRMLNVRRKIEKEEKRNKHE